MRLLYYYWSTFGYTDWLLPSGLLKVLAGVTSNSFSQSGLTMNSTIIIVCLISLGSSVNNRRKGPRREISNGVLVDYTTFKRSYSFMARFVMDAAFRCGGAIISDRCYLVIEMVNMSNFCARLGYIK